MSIAIYSNYPASKNHNHKWRTYHATVRKINSSPIYPSSMISPTATIPSHRSSQKKTQTSMSSFSSSPPPSTKLTVTSGILLTKTRDHSIPEFQKKKKGWFWFRKWDLEDVFSICSFIGIHVLAACAPFVVFDWGAVRVSVVLGFLSGFGVTLGYHRLLCHRSFKIPKWLEYFFVYCGAHAFQRDPMFYVNTHKNHHRYTDTDRDPVAPTHGFWCCNMGWFFNNQHIAAKCGESRGGEYSKVPELKAQWFYRFLHDTYFWHPTALATLLYLHGGFPYLALAMGVRAVVVHHFASLATHASHIWGERPWNTPDASTNNWWVAVLTLGEGWHNNHHAFPISARHGLECWQIDLTWELIKFLQLVGLARDVKLLTEADKRRISLHWADSKQKNRE